MTMIVKISLAGFSHVKIIDIKINKLNKIEYCNFLFSTWNLENVYKTDRIIDTSAKEMRVWPPWRQREDSTPNRLKQMKMLQKNSRLNLNEAISHHERSMRVRI